MKSTILVALLLGCGTAFAAIPRNGNKFQLECAVAGKVSVVYVNSRSPPETRLDPATVQVQVDQIGEVIFINIEGPSEYALALDSTPSTTKRIVARVADPYTIGLEIYHQDGDLQINTSARLNRQTGTISVLETVADNSHLYVKQTSYFGTCNKVNRDNPKF